MPDMLPLLLRWFDKTCWHKRYVILFSMLASLHIQQTQAALGIEPHIEQTREPAMLWPLLPGESLQTLANKLYPQSPILQQRFVQQALTYSRHRGILLHASDKVERAQLIAVPNAEAMHTVTRRIKKADEDSTPSPNSHRGLMLSMQITPHHTEQHMTPLLPSIHLPHWAQQLEWKRPHWLNEMQWPNLMYHPDLPDNWQEVKSRVQYNSLRWYQAVQTHARVALSHVQALATQAQDNYQANTQKIARTPWREFLRHPQQTVIVTSALLLLALSVLWGVQEARK